MPAARVAIAATATFVVLVAALHLIKADSVDPSWQTTSEYAIGQHGWIMVIAFLAQATSYVALYVAVRSQVGSIPGRLGLGILLVSAAGAAVGGVFVADPIETPVEEFSTSGLLHGIGAGSALWFLPLAMLLVSVSLARHNSDWSSSRRRLAVTATLPILAVVMFMSAQAAMVPDGGHFGPGVDIGWPERLQGAAYVISIVMLATRAIRLRTRTSSPLHVQVEESLHT